MKYLGLTAMIVAASPAAAQTPQAGAAPSAPSPATDAAATSTTTSLGDIVFTAQRRSERLQDVPLTVTALSGAQMAKAGVTSLRDI